MRYRAEMIITPIITDRSGYDIDIMYHLKAVYTNIGSDKLRVILTVEEDTACKLNPDFWFHKCLLKNRIPLCDAMRDCAGQFHDISSFAFKLVPVDVEVFTYPIGMKIKCKPYKLELDRKDLMLYD